MKKILLMLSLLMVVAFSWGQNANDARKILDKTAAKLSNRGGVSANFKLSGKFGNTSGFVAIKGSKFYASTPVSTVWYDGKTQWTYLKRTQEVNVSTPTEAQQQSMNPYKFLHIYKNGYRLDMKPVASGWQIHLTAINKARSIKEMYVEVTKSYMLKTVKMRQGSGWSTITVSGFKKTSLLDSQFRFNSKDYPNAEVIDLR